MTITKVNPNEGDLEYHWETIKRLLIFYRTYQDNQAI